MQQKSSTKIAIREISCKTALSPSLLPGYDYALNPYRGCEHACVYCYAPSVLRCSDEEKWGTFVEPRINIARVLSREVRKKQKGVVGISTVTDPYQKAEKKYELTRSCIELLLGHDFPVTVQTKSALVLRDLDLIKKFSKIEVGFTITTVDDEARKKYEQNAGSVEERLGALLTFHENDIPTFAFLGPLMPGISDKDLEAFIRAIAKTKVDYVMIDRLRMKPGLWSDIEAFLTSYDASLIPGYREILFKPENSYFLELRSNVVQLCKKYGLRCEPCF